MVVQGGNDASGRVTITDVAREAGVSVATVSKVVNGRYGVAPATQKAVLAVVERLGYVSSLGASSLRQGATNVIGVLLAGFESYSAEILKGISMAAVGRGYQLLAYSGAIADPWTVGWEKRSISQLGGTIIDGAIIITPTVALPRTKMPIVAIDPPHSSPEAKEDDGADPPAATLPPDEPPYVESDSFSGAKYAVEYLIALGHRKIGHIRGRLDLDSAHKRELGWRTALQENGIEPVTSWLGDGGYFRPWAYEAAMKMLESADRPTAIFAANDQSAFGVLDAARQLGLAVPLDLSVIGYDDTPEAALSAPPLTTVAQPLQEIGAQAFDMVFDLLNGVPVPDHVEVPAKVVIRASAAPPPGVAGLSEAVEYS